MKKKVCVVSDLVLTREYLAVKIAQKKTHIGREQKRLEVLENLLRECGGEIK